MADVNMTAFMERSAADGPGTRYVIWVQGCPFRCPGCANPDMQPFVEKKLVPAQELTQRILAIRGIGGVTFSGGEPFRQTRALSEVAHAVRAAGLTVMTYSGYLLEDLRRVKRADWNALLDATDLLIDGPFVQELAGNHLWRGSDNQRLHYLSGRIRPPEDEQVPRAQVRILPDGRVPAQEVREGPGEGSRKRSW